MKLGEKIRFYRKQQGLTQEQVAEKLGVSTPAVNKWENDNSYPDITMLSPLARLLNTDVNTLLSFRENLTMHEIEKIVESIADIFRREGFESGFENGETHLKEYPNDSQLALHMGELYARHLKMAPTDSRVQYEKRILRLMEQAGESEEQKTAEAALSWQMHYYAGQGEFEKAEEVLSQVPDAGVDKVELQISLERKKGDYKTAKLYCRDLLNQKSTAILNILGEYETILKETGEDKEAANIAEIGSAAAVLFKNFRMGEESKK